MFERPLTSAEKVRLLKEKLRGDTQRSCLPRGTQALQVCRQAPCLVMQGPFLPFCSRLYGGGHQAVG